MHFDLVGPDFGAHEWVLGANMMFGSNKFFLERVVEESTRTYVPLAKATGAELLVVPSPHLPMVYSGEASRVRRLLTGLLAQAVFFRDGEVRMEIFAANDNPLLRHGDEQQVSLGIAVESVPSTRRESASSSLLREQKSLCGSHDEFRMSLDACRELARTLGGDVHVSKTPGGLYVMATVVLGVTASQPQMPPFQVPLEDGRKVLIIDDSASLRTVLAEMLGLLGMETLSASSIQASSELVQWNPGLIGAVLVDGDLVSGEARQDMLSAGVALVPDVPVVIMDYADASGANNVQESRRAIQERLLKPVTPSALRNALESVFERWAAEHAPASKASCAYMSAFSGLRALLVDDNEFNLEVLESILDMAGMQVAKATSGQDALSILVRDPEFDVVLMDMQMPIMDGCETTRRIRANPKLEGVPIIALTANTIPGAREQCLASGMNDFLRKPVDTPVMFKALAQWIPRRS